ncbi:MAG TPA: hypothetical protein VN887_01425 [Candidatus Angelobacter sp.]|nr:hypothetical protein [Candidatus Angelobacter sp.]
MNALDVWESRIMALDAKLRPLAQRPVDVTRAGWVERLRSGVPPLDEADARFEAEKLLGELSAAYAQGTEETRNALRRMFAGNRSFAWAVSWAERAAGAPGLRQRLILFSMQDQGQDSRDALLTLEEICREAATAGVDIEPALREVADLSSGVNKYGMGSTRDLLLKHCPAR